MAHSDKIEEFKAWATSLGCAPSVIPADEDLRNIFKSGSHQLFAQLQRRIRPREEVEEIRANLLIAQVERHKGKVVPLASRSLLPPQLQRLQQMKELTKAKETAEQTLKDARQEYDKLSASIKSKNIQTIRAKNKRDLLESKCNMLELKLESMKKSYEQELRNKAQILASTPVQLSSENASEKRATKVVEQALKELDTFYGVCNDETNSADALAQAKERLWNEMRIIFSKTPNAPLFNVIMKIKEKQLQYIMQLSTANKGNTPKAKPLLTNYEVKLLKTKAEMLGLAARYLSADKELVKLEARFCQDYTPFVDELQKKVNSFNAIASTDVDSTDELISDFLVQFTMRTFNIARNDFLVEQIEQLRQELKAGAKQLENHDLILSSVKQVYSAGSTSINRIQEDMGQLSQIKEKILYSRNMMKNLLDDMHAATQSQNAKSQLISTKLKVNNMSMLSSESFYMANDSVFCSTKLEFDGNNSIANSTLVPGAAGSAVTLTSGPGTLVPCHLLELNTFAEMPLVKFSCVPRSCAGLLSANPLIVEAQELASTVQLVPGHLLTPFRALQEVRKRILWASAIAAHTSDLKLSLQPLIVDPHDLKLKARRQQDKIEQKLDSITGIAVKSRLQLEKAERIYHFILENPLNRYVPPTKVFSNGTFSDYESEFNLYYRMATMEGSVMATK
ncbi:augmin complex subunit dgt5 [Drosophila miranda]|uniref:augmin complex subunit dgt5 n=1 Tax=Drosophila miranda TaxID=7229 RepID=UPI00143F416A|nr:augmin complex subunit dgt5 [Drosophila miranda]